MSVGIVLRQDFVAAKKKIAKSANTEDFYRQTVKETSEVAKLLQNGYLDSDIHTASDWSYSASEYASPYVRIAGDAGCFIDPLFSSGVHLAMNSGLSAALTICATLRGDCTEQEAVEWHSDKVAEGYTRFLMVATSAHEQIRGKDKYILNNLNEAGFDTAFDHFRPSMHVVPDKYKGIC